MWSYSRGRVGAIAVITAVAIGGVACPFPSAESPIVAGLVGIHSESREALGGGYVTVDMGVIPGPLPDTNMIGSPTIVAWFSNRGEGGKREKRYDLKPRSDAEYELVLSSDGSGRTKWTMNEINRATLVKTAFHSGHLWTCDPTDHSALSRAVGFKDCTRAIDYDSYSPGGVQERHRMIVFASNNDVGSEDEDRMSASAPIWISCSSGCCTLGR